MFTHHFCTFEFIINWKFSAIGNKCRRDSDSIEENSDKRPKLSYKTDNDYGRKRLDID